MEDDLTIKEYIDIRKEQIESTKDSFTSVESIYASTESTRKTVVNKLYQKSAAIYLKYFIRSVFNTNLSIEIENLVGKLLATAKTAKDERNLLIIINNTINELKRYEIVDCNPRIANILMLIFEKNTLLLKQAEKYILSTNSRMKRLDVIEGNLEERRIKEIDEEVDSIVLSLGLKK